MKQSINKVLTDILLRDCGDTWKKETMYEGEAITYYLYGVDGSRISVLDRLTGYGDGDIRDIETGYKDKDGLFWLASGNFDIREYGELSYIEAVDKIKKNANTCVGG